jgi:hypothetical protein
MAILHFSGKFKFHVPLYNNIPSREELEFNSQIEPKESHKNFGVDPLQYYEFEFLDVFVSKITYDDGTSTLNPKNDPIIGKKVLLKGLLVDVAPHLEIGRLFASEFRVVDFLMGKLAVALQSELAKNIKTDILDNIQNESFCYSAFFDTRLYEIYKLTNEEVTKENSRFLKEIDNNISNLKVHFTVNRFINKSSVSDNEEAVINEGNIYGYISEETPSQNNSGIRLKERHLIFNPNLNNNSNENDNNFPSDIFKDFNLKGTYEIQEEKRLLLVSYISFIHYIDLNYNTFQQFRYFIKIFYEDQEIPYSKEDLEIETNGESLIESGGIKVFKIPENVYDLSKLYLIVILTKENNNEFILMIEPDYDIVLDENSRYVYLESNKHKELVSFIFHKNKLADGLIPIILENPTLDQKSSRDEKSQYKSPVVAKWMQKEKEPTGNKKSNELTINAINGVIRAVIEAINLEDSGKIYDPVNDIYLEGELPWNRYYGNEVSFKIDINGNYKIQRDIPVRVLHSVNLELNNKEIKSLEIVKKLFSYYMRYYPWLHTSYRQHPNMAKSGYVYQRFLELDKWEYNHHNWADTKGVIDNIDKIVERLSRKDEDWRKMPRSRDFPINGVEFIKKWRTQILDGLLHGVNDYIKIDDHDYLKKLDKLIEESDDEKDKDFILALKRYIKSENLNDEFTNVQDYLKKLDKLIEESDDEKDKDFIKSLKLRTLIKVSESIHNLKHEIQRTHIHSE